MTQATEAPTPSQSSTEEPRITRAAAGQPIRSAPGPVGIFLGLAGLLTGLEPTRGTASPERRAAVARIARRGSSIHELLP